MKLNAEMIPEKWRAELSGEFEKPYMQKLAQFLADEKSAGKTIFPAEENIFNSLKLTEPNQINVVIFGQDPYHGEGQAHGLCFSVRDGVKIPPSLKNIYKELESDIGFKPTESGILDKWAKQGVLLLNSVLTVESGNANSHQKKGWEKFTDAIVEVVNQHSKNCVFLLWGKPAQKKGENIDKTRHLILEAPHPSPLSAHRGFLGCKHFSKTNEYLVAHKKAPIDWQI